MHKIHSAFIIAGVKIGCRRMGVTRAVAGCVVDAGAEVEINEDTLAGSQILGVDSGIRSRNGGVLHLQEGLGAVVSRRSSGGDHIGHVLGPGTFTENEKCIQADRNRCTENSNTLDRIAYGIFWIINRMWEDTCLAGFTQNS
jgi:hypothetical protein